MISRPYFAAALSTLTLLCAGTAVAAPVLDQRQEAFGIGIPFGFSTSGNNLPVGQSFTAGLTGRLTSIQLFSNGTSDLNGLSNTVTMSVRAGATRSSTALGTATYTGHVTCTATCWFSFDFSSQAVDLVGGNAYHFDITSVTGPGAFGSRGIVGTSISTYAGGRVLPMPGYGSPDWDLTFRTYVDTSITSNVPEPGTLALAGLALLAAAGLRRKV
ncbi:PEP-CTERM sorting domain-containing protein [Rubrivivax rivuli]|uniref:PEP-CTERM sorting domain-containing protein n=1 Tax=Rubrivivax rivuli TaxID=1862385 RepID=A0A437RLY6_9BURK|nr:PEP-CTERM sorting domain-containing protein [Rubrivivax rivuli]RVU47622.1 PEP-CTERM sorting domain-containing protein [Rubrivivax rivuli]